MSKILNLRKIEVSDDLTYPLSKLPLDNNGNLKVEICSVWKYRKIQKLIIYPKYNGMYNDTSDPIYFEITPIKKNYFSLYNEVKVDEVWYCKEHKSQTIVGYIDCKNKSKLLITVLSSMTSIGTF
jgi:hypothetical protein